MMVPDDTKDQHLSNARLIWLLDDELTGEEAVAAESHLAACAVCRDRFSELRRTSNSFDSFISSFHPASLVEERQQLAKKLDLFENQVPKIESRWNRKFASWGLAVAAALALAVLFIPHREAGQHVAPRGPRAVETAFTGFEVDGETFTVLPYSNPDLTSSAPHIVQMQVPVSSLVDAGIYVEPSGSHVSAPDRAVLADVLLGLDGQPLGVHVLTSD